MKYTLIIPTLNEIDGVREIMPKIRAEWYDQLIIVDGNSTDGTIEYLREEGYPVYLQKKKGMRNAYMEIYDLIEGDVMMTFSPDGNSIPELIPQLREKMEEGYDMVIVSRYLGGATSEDDDSITGFGNWLFTKAINVLHGSSYTDAMVIFRAYKKDLVKRLDLHKKETYWPENIFRTNLSWEPILSVRCAKRKLKVTEIPGDEPKRIGGERKLQVIRWGLGYMAQVIAETVYWR
jgi:glycosyltransferase involved in cell wall biosynthesis